MYLSVAQGWWLQLSAPACIRLWDDEIKCKTCTCTYVQIMTSHYCTCTCQGYNIIYTGLSIAGSQGRGNQTCSSTSPLFSLGRGINLRGRKSLCPHPLNKSLHTFENLSLGSFDVTIGSIFLLFPNTTSGI